MSSAKRSAQNKEESLTAAKIAVAQKKKEAEEEGEEGKALGRGEGRSFPLSVLSVQFAVSRQSCDRARGGQRRGGGEKEAKFCLAKRDLLQQPKRQLAGERRAGWLAGCPAPGGMSSL